MRWAITLRLACLRARTSSSLKRQDSKESSAAASGSKVFCHFEPDAAALDSFESCRFNDELVRARRQARRNVIAHLIGLERPRHTSINVGDDHVCAFDEATALVGHCAQNAALLRLTGRDAQHTECG